MAHVVLGAIEWHIDCVVCGHMCTQALWLAPRGAHGIQSLVAARCKTRLVLGTPGTHNLDCCHGLLYCPCCSTLLSGYIDCPTAMELVLQCCSISILSWHCTCQACARQGTDGLAVDVTVFLALSPGRWHTFGKEFVSQMAEENPSAVSKDQHQY
jgi:hypothetical protein